MVLSSTYLFQMWVKSNSRLIARRCSSGELKSAENLKLCIDVPAAYAKQLSCTVTITVSYTCHDLLVTNVNTIIAIGVVSFMFKDQ